MNTIVVSETSLLHSVTAEQLKQKMCCNFCIFFCYYCCFLVSFLSFKKTRKRNIFSVTARTRSKMDHWIPTCPAAINVFLFCFLFSICLQEWLWRAKKSISFYSSSMPQQNLHLPQHSKLGLTETTWLSLKLPC